MVSIYLGFDISGTGGLGTTDPDGGGRIDFYKDAASVSQSLSNVNTSVITDFSNGILYNPVTGQWIGAVANEGISYYDTLEDMAADNYTHWDPYSREDRNYNNGIAYKADTNTYVGAYYVNGVQTVKEFATTFDMANDINPIKTSTGVGNYNNGIEYNSVTGEWYAAWNGGGNGQNGAVLIFSTFEDFLANKPKVTYPYFARGADYEMGMATVTCFTRGTLIETNCGPVAIEDLTIGDRVRTLDHGYKPIRWIGSRRLDAKDLANAPTLRPIRIAAGALAANVPAADLIVSPQHRVLVRSKIAHRMFGTDEVLVAAKQLLELDGVSIVENAEPVEYFHILLDQHQVVFSNGAATESLYVGAQALRSVSSAAREEIFQIFPELKSLGGDQVPKSARSMIKGGAGRRLISRHIRNNRDIIAMKL